MNLIHIQNLSKHFTVLKRRKGLGSAFGNLFSNSYRTVEALLLCPEDVSPLIDFSQLISTGRFTITYWIWTQGVNSYTGTGS